MCRVLNMSDFWIFVNFPKYDKVLNMHQDATIEDFLVFLDSNYAGFQKIQALCKVVNVSEYGSIMHRGRVLNMTGQPFTGF